MSIIDGIIPIILTLGLIQGLILGSMLIFLDGKKNRSTLFLGLFILAYALELIIPILKYSDIIAYYPSFKLFPVDFRWLTFPLFYVYVQNISIIPKVRRIYYILIPGGIAFIVNVIVFFQPAVNKEIIRNSTWFQLFDLVGLMFSFFIAIKIYFFINKHTTELKNQYSFTQNKELQWVKIFLLIGIAFTVVSFGLNPNTFYFILTMSIVNVVLLYWISIKGIRQQNVQTLIPIPEKEVENIEADERKATRKQKTNEDIELVKKIDQYFLNQKEYLKPDLTIADVSQYVNEHPKRVSLAINIVAERNFKSFVNSYRIAEAKRLLQDKSAVNYSIEGIGSEVGFKSKSVFYSIFKKETGLTPNKFRNQQ